jgi:hypothetical protein
MTDTNINTDINNYNSTVVMPEIQFGTFASSDQVAFLEATVYQLEQEKRVLLQSLIDNENKIQREKAEYMAGMSQTMHNNNIKCAEVQNLYDELQYTLASEKARSCKLEHELIEEKKKSDEITKLKNDLAESEKMGRYIKIENGTLYTEIAGLKNIINRMEKEAKVKNEAASKKNEAAAVKNTVKTCSVGVECKIEDTIIGRKIERLSFVEKKLIETAALVSMNEEIIQNLSIELDNEKMLSNSLHQTVTNKVAMMHRERDLREDFEEIANSMRMYLEIWMIKMREAISNSGFTEFAKVAYDMYKAYCDGTLEKLITDVSEQRKKVPRSTDTSTIKAQFMRINGSGSGGGSGGGGGRGGGKGKHKK